MFCPQDERACCAVKTIVKPFKKTGGGKLTVNYLAAHSLSSCLAKNAEELETAFWKSVLMQAAKQQTWTQQEGG